MHWFKSNHKAITLKFNEETGSATCVVLLLLPPVHDLTLMSRPSDSSQWHVLEVEQGPQDGRSFRFFPWICPWFFHRKYMDVSKNSGFSTPIIHFNMDFPLFSPSILGYPKFLETPIYSRRVRWTLQGRRCEFFKEAAGQVVNFFKKRFCVKFSGLLVLKVIYGLYHYITFQWLLHHFLNSPLHIAANNRNIGWSLV